MSMGRIVQRLGETSGNRSGTSWSPHAYTLGLAKGLVDSTVKMCIRISSGTLGGRETGEDQKIISVREFIGRELNPGYTTAFNYYYWKIKSN